MAKNIFLDANIFIDILEKRPFITVEALSSNNLFVSVLSLHIYLYVYKIDIPFDNKLLWGQINFIDYTIQTSQKALTGPTKDFEDNIQLHSAIDAHADLFITRDKKLLSLGYFGACQIVDSL
ncbi:hypothetical protein COX05_04610 [candidate division WWE3 bacterium CG22_combo_CG10-13_8_21_14_all_39_12]|uniref:PIN domain-containing protein n=1 Tax=candidate division WWE3 bacterium CG22_combo_CG10-13_8_21_14_all_39_12 TaxID=1975094 RepID=A0A2H0BEP3_UNCKA|nr:MAG: hypothetical protein COX05_04610 [candidate division WWE3 bacterium CG22_combo_CG10-13_8_21_14_all_39_12]